MNLPPNSNLSSAACQTIISKIQYALGRYIPERCQELNRILHETSYKELHTIFPYLVENIFGYGCKPGGGWGLMGITRNYKAQDFHSLREFLGSKGPLLQVAYKMLADGRTQFEFPVSCLPLTTRHLLDEGNIPSLYTNKVPFCGPGRPVSHIMLNSFEYYLFHFAYFIVNPVHSKDLFFSTTLVDSLYPSLLEDYMLYFLPTDGNPIPPVPHATIPNYRPAAYSSPAYLAMHPNYIASRGPNSPNVQPYDAYHAFGSPLTYQTFKRTNTPRTEPSQDEIWRSQSLVLVLVEFWLNLSSSDTPGVMLNHVFQEAFIPSHVQMQLVRLFVKHMHYFANSCVPDTDNSAISNLSFQTLNSIEDFKRTAIQCLQKKLYVFLKLSFERWPIDSYFRLVLETWLSYIQPWRYEKMSIQNNTNDSNSRDRIVDNKWKDFVAENLLFYTGIFQKLLPRYFRIDLDNPRNSYLILRVTKVFTLKNLQEMIMEAENRLLEPSVSQFANQMYQQGSNSGQLRQNISELEGFGFNYEPMFGASVRSQVLSLLGQISAAQISVSKMETRLTTASNRTWLQTIGGFFSLENSRKEDMNLADVKKTQTFLDISMANLGAMFKLNAPPPVLDMLDSSLTSTLPTEESSYLNLDCKGLPIEPTSIKNITFQGNPDLQPIRSYEVAFLVRMFFHMSTMINERYQNDINMVYSSDGLLGRISRQLLVPPTVCHSSYPGRETIALPPRVSLRFLAHGQLLGYLTVAYLIAYALGYGPFSFLIFVTGLVLLVATVKATCFTK